MEWIPVSQALPDVDTYVLAVSERLGVQKMHFTMHNGTPYWGLKANEPVTHWMPLPDPPKED